MIRSMLHLTYKLARRIVIAVIGATVVLVGVAMILLPGPAIVVIPMGLGILSAEFAWARRWLHSLRHKAQSALKGLRRRNNSTSSLGQEPDE